MIHNFFELVDANVNRALDYVEFARVVTAEDVLNMEAVAKKVGPYHSNRTLYKHPSFDLTNPNPIPPSTHR